MKKRIHFEIVSRYDKQKEPAVTGVPFGKGELKPDDIDHLVVTDGSFCCEAQFKPTAFWDDQTVKWLLVTFLADLPANEEKDYFIEYSKSLPNLSLSSIRINIDGKKLLLDNGQLCLQMAEPEKNYIFEKIITNDHTWEHNEIKGPVITSEDGTEYTIHLDKSGWEIIEAGPVRAMIRAKGTHCSNTHMWMDFSLILTLWAGKPWIHLDYQFINREDDRSESSRTVMELNNEQAGLKYDKNYPYETIRSIRMELMPDGKNETVNHGIYTSSFNFHAKKASKEETLSEQITADTIVNTANEMFPEVLFSIFSADWMNENFAVAAGIYQAYQNFPKALDSSASGITIHLLPDTGSPLKVPQGAARTSRFYLYFHPRDLDEHMLVDRIHQFEIPALPVADSKAFSDSHVFGAYVSDRYHHPTERFLYRYVDSRAKGLGMMNFGDGPEWEYMKQGRSKGEIIWINNEYDMPHNFMVMLARTGDRRYFDYMKAAAEHWYDVDLCHYSNRPYRAGLLYTHSVDHVSGQPVPSHQWVEGFLDYYHMTGNPNGLEAAMSIGDNLLKLMELPLYHTPATVEPREIGWAMRTFMALYRETKNKKWLDACSFIVDVYEEWEKALGTWTTPYPDNYMDRVPFMMHVGIVGLYQYYEFTKNEKVKQTMLAVINDIIKHCYIQRANVFFGKQHPSVRFLNLNGMVLESLAIAYELTEKEEYIEKGLGMFLWITQENQPPIYDFSKYKENEYTVIYNCPAGPKRCAQTLLPLLHYYRYALDLGFLTSANLEGK